MGSDEAGRGGAMVWWVWWVGRSSSMQIMVGSACVPFVCEGREVIAENGLLIKNVPLY